MEKLILSKKGVLPNTDITLSLLKVFEEHKENTTFVFEEGDYFFSPKEELKHDYNLSNTTHLPLRTLGAFMKNMKNCAVEGNGARFWFEGHMQPLTLDHCENITVKDLTFNWKKPLVAEGIVKAVTDEYVDLCVSSESFPHRLNGDQIEFDVGAGEWYTLFQSPIIFEPHFRTVRRNTADCFWIKSVGATDEKDVYRFHLHRPTNTEIGDIVVLRHNERYHAGIFTEKCKDITFDNITVHCCGGLGCLSQFCENMTYSRMYFLPDRSLGRFVTNGRDDGMHITCNKGKVKITDCSFVGLMDDPINVHGCAITGDELKDEKTIICHYKHIQAMGFDYWAEEGDEIAFIDRPNMSRVATAKAKSYKVLSRDTVLVEFKETLSEEIVALINAGRLALDNLTNTCEFICKNNRFGSCRARGILVSTPKTTVIENNYFESSGAAILVPGDANNWYESGEVGDLTIRNNVFTHACLTSVYEFCQGMISICPTIPEPDRDKPFHKNIRIIGNTFDSSDTPVLYGYSCKGLTFKDNLIFKSPAYEKNEPNKARINLRYCQDVEIENNAWVGNFSSEILKEE